MPNDFLGNPIHAGDIVVYADRENNHATLKLYLVTEIEEGNKRIYRPDDVDQFTLHVKYFGYKWVDRKKVFDETKVKETVFGRYERCVILRMSQYNDECRALQRVYVDLV